MHLRCMQWSAAKPGKVLCIVPPFISTQRTEYHKGELLPSAFMLQEQLEKIMLKS